MRTMRQLLKLRESGMQPVGGAIWIGIGIAPPKRNALVIDPENMPTDDDCRAVAGLDVLVCFCGYLTKYGTLRRLCGSLLQARPRRLQLIDHDHKRIAFLKLGARE